MTIQEKPEDQIALIRAQDSIKKRKELAFAYLATAEALFSGEQEPNKRYTTVADFGDHVFISSTLILRKEDV